MSQTIPISSTSKKRLDEKNGKIVKELSLLLENRNCVECGMRGPTYVDMTTTSFCCATCAGVLRGINPPHRIKSISMATFTCEEVETLRNGGNELNRRTWTGLDTGAPVTHFVSKEDRINYICNKYERKKWYVSPEEVTKQKELLDRALEAKSEQLKMTNTRNDSMDVFSSLSLGGTPSARPPPSVSLDSVFAPPSMLTGMTVDKMLVMDEPHPFSPPAFMAPPPPQPGAPPSSLPINQQPTHMPINFAFGSPPTSLMPQSRQPTAFSGSASSVLSPVDPFSPLSSVGKQFPSEPNRSAPSSSSTLPPSSNGGALFGGDPFGSTAGGDPFGPSFSGFAVKFDEDTPTSSAPPARGNAFDPFTMAYPTQSSTASQPSPLPPVSVPVPPPSSVDPFASLGFSSLPPAPLSHPSVSPVLRATPPVATATMPPPHPTPHPTPTPSNPPVVTNNDADKYSALAELDELFHSTTISSESSNGKPSWVSTGFSAPPPTSAAAFPMGRSSTMGAISASTALPSSLTPSSSAFGSTTQSSSATSHWGGVPSTGGTIPPFAAQTLPQQTQQGYGLGAMPQPSLFPQNHTAAPPSQPYAQAAAFTGNPFAAFNQVPNQSMTSTSGQHPQNPNWNPFL